MVDGYIQVYDSGEMSEVTIDIIVKIIVAFVGFGTLIALVFLYQWWRKSGVKF
jgi:hypothetical protein